MPTIVLPPPKNKKQAGRQNTYRAYINAHPGLKPWAAGIWKWANYYGIDPVYYASLIQHESHGDNSQVSSAGAIGLGQIMPLHVGEDVPWDKTRKVTPADLRNPAFNLRWSAWYFSTKLGDAGGNYVQAYNGPHGYNQGGPNIFTDIPNGYLPIGSAQSPQDAAARSAETSAARADLTDPYVGIRNGRLVNVTNPKNAVRVFGVPLRRSQFMQTWSQINDVYLQYTGHSVKAPHVAAILRQGLSDYQLKQQLAKSPGFIGSPVWQQNSPQYIDAWHQIYGEDSTPDNAAIRYAIVNNIGPSGFADRLRQRPDYVNSNEFSDHEAALASVYTSIYGVPDQQGQLVIRKAVLGGWTQAQFENYLTHQPEYGQSADMQKKALYLAQGLGFFTGDMSPNPNIGNVGANPNGNPLPGPPNDPRANPTQTVTA